MAEKWIQKAIEKPGALTKTAKRSGQYTSDGGINPEWVAEKAKEPGTIGRRARLAQTLKKMRTKAAKK